MCENCKNVLFDYRGKSHSPLDCPFLKIAYCGICCKRGHFHTDCPDTVVQSSRKPEFMEQLIPPSLKERYRIRQSCTPLPHLEPLPAKVPPSMWEIPKKDAEYLKKFLKDHEAILNTLGLKIKQSREQNEIILMKLAESQNKIVVWTKSAKHAEKDEVPPPTPQPTQQVKQDQPQSSKKKSVKKIILTATT